MGVGVAGRASPSDLVTSQYIRYLLGGPVNVVIYHHVVGDPPAQLLLDRSQPEPVGDAGLVITP